MLVIANNLSFMNRDFMKAAKEGDGIAMSSMAEVLKKAGAEALDVNLSMDGDGDEKYMAAAVESVQKAGLPVFIDSRNPDAMSAALDVAKVPVALNYISAEPKRSARMREIAKLAAAHSADLVLYAMKRGTPADADERLAVISELMDMAGDAGVPNERLIIDPVILHLGGDVAGQRHAVAVRQTLQGLMELVDPPVRTTCWISNVSAGAPRELRPVINDTFLAMLAGLGLSSAFLDVFDRQTMRTVRLVRALNNEALYSPSDAEL